MPGFGFSGSPKKPIGPRRIAKIMNKLMTKNLKYKKYIAQGGDWGAAICNWLGYNHPNSCKAIHVNCLTMRHPKGPRNTEEKEAFEEILNSHAIIDQKDSMTPWEKGENSQTIIDYEYKQLQESLEFLRGIE